SRGSVSTSSSEPGDRSSAGNESSGSSPTPWNARGPRARRSSSRSWASRASGRAGWWRSCSRSSTGRRTSRSGGKGGPCPTAWRRFLEGIAEQRPLVVVFEDIHWADDGLLDFVDHLADWAGPVPLLIVCMARPELLDRRPGWGGGKRNAATLSIGALTKENTSRLLAALLGRAP